jgi:ABC-type multidrug transport system fused ATPase/permease subunit
MINQIYQSLDSHRKRGFVFLIFCNAILFFFEFLSLASIPVFVTTVIDSDFALEKLKIIQNYIPFINIENIEKNIEIYAGIFTVSLFFLKNIFFIFFIVWQAMYFKHYKISLSEQIYKQFLFMPYDLYVTKNPSKFTRVVTGDIQGTFHYINSFLILLRESLALLAIFILLLYINPKLNITIAFLLVLIVVSYLKIIKPILKAAAQKNQFLRKKNIQLINETSGSLKEIKLSLQENFLINFFKDQINGIEKNLARMFIIDKLPRIILELTSFSLIVIISMIYFKSASSIQSALPTLSLILISVVRFIPAFNGVATSINALKIYKVSVQAIYDDLLLKEFVNENDRISNIEINNSNEKNKKIIEINDVSFSYKGSNFPQIKNLNLKIKEGDVVAITGKTGSGKSTIFLMLLGLLKPTKGNIFYNGQDIFNHIRGWRKLIGYVSQKVYLLDRSIKENIQFNFDSNIENENKLDQALNIADLEDVIKDMKKGVNTLVGNDGIMLSGGEKQRIAIARTVYKNPEILIMDEFTSALDEETEIKIIRNLKKMFSKKTILIITHRKSTLEICDKIYELKNGELNNLK